MMLLFRAAKMSADCEKLQEDFANQNAWARQWEGKFTGSEVRKAKIPHEAMTAEVTIATQ